MLNTNQLLTKELSPYLFDNVETIEKKEEYDTKKICTLEAEVNNRVCN